jgi:hypothetical protein
MRYGIVLGVLAAAALVCSGCGSAPASSTPAVPATPAKPAEPEKAMMKPPSKPAEAAKTTDATRPPAPVLDKTPIKADVSKIKFTATPAELFGWDDGESRAFFYTNGLGEVTLNIPADGDYDVVVTASCQAAKGENAKFKLKVDGTQVGAETQLKSEDAKDYTLAATLKAGERKIGTEFTNDMYKEGEYDLNFYLHGLKVVRVK